MKKLTATFGATALLAACATGVVPMDQGTYMIGKQGGAFATPESTKAYAYSAATEFCAEKNLQVETIKVEARGSIPFVRAAGAELQFRCVPPK